MQVKFKSVLLIASFAILAVGNLKADSFEEWSRQRRDQWADDQAAWQDQWNQQNLENRLEAIEAELNGE